MGLHVTDKKIYITLYTHVNKAEKKEMIIKQQRRERKVELTVLVKILDAIMCKLDVDRMLDWMLSRENEKTISIISTKKFICYSLKSK